MANTIDFILTLPTEYAQSFRSFEAKHTHKYHTSSNEAVVTSETGASYTYFYNTGRNRVPQYVYDFINSQIPIGTLMSLMYRNLDGYGEDKVMEHGESASLEIVQYYKSIVSRMKPAYHTISL